MNFDDFVARFDSGEIVAADIDKLIDIVHPDDADARAARRERVMPGGNIVKFQAVGLNKQAETAWKENRVAEVAAKIAPPERPDSVPDFYNNDLPEEVYDEPRENYIPEIKKRVGIVQAVRTWGKPQATIKDNRTEGVKVRCPFPDHVDNRPSAWVNTEKNTFYCGVCEVGGDVIDFYAAAKHGLRPVDFHKDSRFAEIIGGMADDLGIQIVSTPEGSPSVEAATERWASNKLDADVEVEEEIPDRPAEVTEQTDDGPLTMEKLMTGSMPPSAEANEPVTISEEEVMRGLALDQTILPDPEDEDAEDNLRFDWRELAPPDDTFLAHWMRQGEIDYPWIPPEYNLMLGFQAISMACAHKTTTVSYGMMTNAQTMVVVIGPSSSGKSVAMARLKKLLDAATGSKYDPVDHTGVKIIKSISSSEALLSRLRSEVIDINDPNMQAKEVPTNGWFQEDEFATFASKAQRGGASHIKQRLMELHDFHKTNPNRPQIAAQDYSLASAYRVIHDTYFTATFLTQPSSLNDLTTRVDMGSGFFNRMWFAFGRTDVPVQEFNDGKADPDPTYIPKYERMWKDCQLKERVIPFSTDAGNLMNAHPLADRLLKIGNENAMFARWRINVVRISLLLAVNENSPLIEVNHVEKAFRFVSEYLIPCASRMILHSLTPETNEVTDMTRAAVDWAERYFDKHGEWPEASKLKNQRFIKTANVDMVAICKKLLIQNVDFVEITLIVGKNPSGTDKKRTVLVVPTGEFSIYADSHGKIFRKDDFYASASAR